MHKLAITIACIMCKLNFTLMVHIIIIIPTQLGSITQKMQLNNRYYVYNYDNFQNKKKIIKLYNYYTNY